MAPRAKRRTVLGFFHHHLRAEARLIAAAVAGVVVWLALPLPAGSTRLLVAWNAGSWLYIALALRTMAITEIGHIKHRSDLEEEGRNAALMLATFAAVAAMVAIGFELFVAKQAAGMARLAHSLLAVATILGSWLLVQVAFALYYAHEFHAEGGGKSMGPRGGLEFPGERAPDYWDFLYFSVVIGATMQTSDVNIASRPMRRLALIHSLIAFVFNTTVIALTVSMAAQLL